MSSKYIRIFLAIFLLATGGCATLNESECRNADWRMIGIEDGINGRLASFIGKHRAACAKHNITPDLVAYQLGHSDGVKQYCTEIKGFEVGKKGVAYNGVCPPELEILFLEGYHLGHKFNTVNRKIGTLSSAINSKQKQVKKIKKEVNKKEQLLISDKSTEKQRSSWLAEVKELQRKVGKLEAEIIKYEKQKAVAEAKVKELNRMNPYY